VLVTRLLALWALLAWAGLTLLLAELRWFARPPLAERLRLYGPVGSARSHSGLLSVESLRAAVGPLARAAGERLARALGVSEDLALRLERIHSPLDVTAFRVRQVAWSVLAFGLAALATAALRPPLPVVGLVLLGAPLLAFLVVEQQVISASRRWQRRLFLELPVVSEQLAMLLSAGYSLTGALDRVARRGRGACASDLQRVCRRVRQGLSETRALREWAAVAQVDALERIVPVLALNHDASDLGRLLSEEARAVRREVQRELIEAVERRGQQVWIPVTVATLVPGVLLMAVPFIEALRLFTA
jgi:tight adherence protein C